MTSPSVASVAQETSMITPRQKFEGHTDAVLGVIHLPGGQQMMTCSGDGSLRVWNLKSGKQIGDEWRDGESEVWTIALSPDGKKVVSGSDDGGVRLWDIDTGKVIGKWMGHTNGVWSVCWSQDGQRVLSGSEDGTAREWDVENGETRILGPTGHRNVYAIVYSPDMIMFATGGNDGARNIAGDTNKSPVKIWDAKTSELVATLKGHTDWVVCLAWTPDGERLISGSYDHLIRIWDTTTWKQIALLDEHTDVLVESIAISPNGRILASAASESLAFDNTVRLWNLDNNQPISSPLQHANVVNSVSFSADGKLLATGCSDENAYTWDVSMILKEAGLDELLLDQRDKSVLAADATRRPVRQPIKVSNRVPQGFFDGTPHRAHSSAQLDLHDAPSQPHIFTGFETFSLTNQVVQRSSRASVTQQSMFRMPRASRNASAREKRMIIIPFKPKNPAASTSCPPNSNATQSTGAAQPQSSSQPQAAVSTPSTTSPAVANTTPNTNPHITIKHPGRWTRFWVSICCASSEYTDGHHLST